MATAATPPVQTDWTALMSQYWVQLAAVDAGILAMILTASCHHINSRTASQAWTNHAVHYQAEAIQSLRRNLELDGDMPGEMAMTKTMCLTSEAVSDTAEPLDLLLQEGLTPGLPQVVTNDVAAAKKHAQAGLRMFQLRMQAAGAGSGLSEGEQRHLRKGPGDSDSRETNLRALLSRYLIKSIMPETSKTKTEHTIDETKETEPVQFCFAYTQRLLVRLAQGEEEDMSRIQASLLSHQCKECIWR